MIDERPVTESVTRLSPGPHAIGVSAPRFNFYSDTVVVRPGEILEVTPPLTPLGAPTPPPARRAPVARPWADATPVRDTTPTDRASTSGPSR